MESKATVSSLAGTWILEKSEHFDEYMKEIGTIRSINQ